MALSSSIAPLLGKVPQEFSGSIKPELMQCYVEINTGVCNTIGEAEADLRPKLACVTKAADELGLRLYWTGTHPFSLWADQNVTPNERYLGIVQLLQDMARHLVTFGLHVHVGVDSGDKAIMICDRILSHLPTLLALSANSPWWDNRVTGLESHRSLIMDSLPTAGLPPLMRNWSEFVWLVNHLVETGYINTIREIWWDVRPHHNFGTVEVRICDMPGSLDDALTLASLIHCLVKALSDQVDEGMYQHDCHPMLVRQNKWRASRFGRGAQLVDRGSYKAFPVLKVAENLYEWLKPVSRELQCEAYLDRLVSLAESPSWAARQLALLAETSDPAEVVRRFTEASRLSIV